MDARDDDSADVLRYELDGDGVAWLTMRRPGAHNALNAALRTALWAAFRRFAEDAGACVAVLEGEGPSFCAGGDLEEMAEQEMRVPPPDYLPYLNRTLELDKPVIALVHGAALGGGFLLAQMADLCVASEDARFGITEARWGRGAPWAAPLPWLIPPRAALEMLLLAEPISAVRAYELGLANRVVPRADLRAAGGGIAETVAHNAPLSVRASKAMVYGAADRGWSESLELADRIFAPVYESADAQEGPRAFRERRAPSWRGR